MTTSTKEMPPFLIEELTDLKNLQKRKVQEKENKALKNKQKILLSFLSVLMVMYLPLVAWMLSINNDVQQMTPIVNAIEKTIVLR